MKKSVVYMNEFTFVINTEAVEEFLERLEELLDCYCGHDWNYSFEQEDDE